MKVSTRDDRKSGLQKMTRKTGTRRTSEISVSVAKSFFFPVPKTKNCNLFNAYVKWFESFFFRFVLELVKKLMLLTGNGGAESPDFS